jgi:pyridoxal phosphate enzyme (YggS family)
MSNIKNNYHQLCHHLAQLEKTVYLREPLRVVAVSKYATVEQIRILYALGQRAFAENYWQTGHKKQLALQDLKIEWHFIGSLQSNKCEEIARHFSWVHSVAKLKHIALLAKAQCSLQICLQVNLSGDAKKYGVEPENLTALAKEVLRYPHLHLRGLMALPKAGETKDFGELAKLRDQLEKNLYIQLPTLSMGMSQDYEAAIKAGSTLIRIGSLLLGEKK